MIMTGLRKICKMFGGMTLGTKKYLWDYANDKPVPAEEMPIGSDRHRASELAKYQIIEE